MITGWLRHDLSRRWGRVVALAVFVALASGIAIAAVAGVRRSSSAFERYEDAVRPATAIAVPNDPDFDWSPVAALPEIETLVEFPVLYFELVGFDGEFGGFPPATPTSLEAMERPVVVRGRAADQSRADEVTITPEVAARGIDVGDRLTIKLPSMGDALAGDDDARDRRRVDVTVVGVAKLSFFAWEVQPTYAFFRQHRDLIADGGNVNAVVKLRNGSTDLAAFEGHLAEIAGYPVEVMNQEDFGRELARAVNVETSALAVLAVAALVVVLVLVGQALTRLVAANPDELVLLRELGASTRATAVAAVAAPATGVFAGVLVAPLVAFALSDRFPIGIGRDIEPQPGRRLDLVAVVPGVLILTVVLGAVLAVAGLRSVPDRRGGRPRPQLAVPSRLLRLPLSIPAAIGARLALGRHSLRAEARAVTWTAVTATAGIVAALTFAAGLDDAIDDPRAFGQPFDVGTLLAEGDTFDPAAYEPLGALGVARLRNVITTIDGHSVSTVSVDPVAGDVTLDALRGRPPSAPEEMALTPQTRELLGVDIGDRVQVAGVDARVVGEMFLPEAGHTSYTSGAVVSPALTDRFVASGLTVKFDFVGADLPEGMDPAAAVARLDEPLRSQIQVWPPNSRQEALKHTAALPGWFGTTVIVLALGAAGHGLSATVRRRHREVAVLQVLGLTRGQARATVFWHAAVAALTGIVIGVPVGFAIGRTLWETVATSLPAFYRSPPAWIGIAVVIPTVLLVALALAGWPARRSAAVEPALILRAE